MTKQLVSLKVKCPLCQQSLMDYTHFLNAKPSIKLTIECGGKHGVINLCSSYGCYDKTSSIELVENDIAKLICPHCKRSFRPLLSAVFVRRPLLASLWIKEVRYTYVQGSAVKSILYLLKIFIPRLPSFMKKIYTEQGIRIFN